MSAVLPVSAAPPALQCTRLRLQYAQTAQLGELHRLKENLMKLAERAQQEDSTTQPNRQPAGCVVQGVTQIPALCYAPPATQASSL